MGINELEGSRTMSVTQTHQAVPAYQPAGSVLTGDALRVAVYLEFLYGFGAAPGIDLGAPKTYSRINTAGSTVYRQDFERGVTIANVGDSAVDLPLEPPLYDLGNARRTSIHLPAHSAEVLLSAPRIAGPRTAS
jgi:hypothetical protein